MDYMTKTKEKIVQSGTTFSNSFTTSPICCPSRSSFLTGFLHVYKKDIKLFLYISV